MSGKAQLRPLKQPPPEEQDPGLRADLLATLIAAKWPDEKILRLTEITPQELSSFRSSPLLKALQRRDQRQNPAEDVADLWPAVIDTWRAAMENRDDLPSALRAADAVANRVLPARQAGMSEPVIHIHLDAKERATVERVITEAGRTIDAQPLLTLDEAVEKYRDREPNGHDS
jgi:hypothetical protein